MSLATLSCSVGLKSHAGPIFLVLQARLQHLWGDLFLNSPADKAMDKTNLWIRSIGSLDVTRYALKPQETTIDLRNPGLEYTVIC